MDKLITGRMQSVVADALELWHDLIEPDERPTIADNYGFDTYDQLAEVVLQHIQELRR